MAGVFVDFSNFTKTINSISFSLFNFLADFRSLFIRWCSATPRLLNNEGNRDKESGASVKDIKLVMSRLGMECEVEDDHDGDSDFVGGDELEGLFREEEPTLEEIRQVFEVFDENKDGYIDAVELSKVLCNLGLLCKNEQGIEDLERCRKMLKSFDRYAVGLLDFDDFLKFMEIERTFTSSELVLSLK
ncbi:hypothetical protein Cgig2_024865 [Carnegiea gigantea]|uniref:EF-hand domain-containing protein n=1 Tax=Carnegiea gigantea TaxID=171969 RepID=A0A9Q1KDH3_9CARY|nr:hypothetical protein Cgig2_024865 [Carnegiea gigantea]